MITKKNKKRATKTACLLAMTLLSGLAAARPASAGSSPDTQATANAPGGKLNATAIKHINDAAEVVRRMKSEPGMSKLMEQAEGVFIVPAYGRAASGAGGSGGTGVLLVKRDDGTWSNPAFYNIDGLSIRAQAGVESGPIALVLNNAKAASRFMQKNNFSLSAVAGLTVVNWAKMAQDSVGTGDVVVWAGTKGLFGNVATVSISDLRFNQSASDAYYHQMVTAEDVISGKAKNPAADTLKQALAASAATGTASGSSGEPSADDTGLSGSDK